MDCCDPPATVELEMTAVEHDLAVRGFVALWHGQRPRPGDLDANPATVDALQQRGLIVVDTDGRITGIHGLSTTPTPHRIAHAGGDTYTWCAFDAIGIPAALRLDAQTRTACLACGRHLDATFTGGQAAALADLRLWLPTMRCDNVLNAVCAHANLYCNQEHLMATVPDDATGTILTVADAAQLGRATWQAAATAVLHRT
jgi:hypothetical protein